MLQIVRAKSDLTYIWFGGTYCPCRMRIFTNDEATVNALARADERVEAFAWNDPLTFGRLPATDELDAYAEARALVFKEAGWDEDDVFESDLKLRNKALRESLEKPDGLTLLFGGSLKDQLQLSQIAAWLELQPSDQSSKTRFMVIDGPLSVFDDGALLEVSKDADLLNGGTKGVYAEAWKAVVSPDPCEVETVLMKLKDQRRHLALAAALERWLQELPSVDNGLSISEAQVLDAVRLGLSFPQELFEAIEETEPAAFRWNWEFWALLKRLTRGPDALLEVEGRGEFLRPPKELAWIEFHDQALALTEKGRAVLECELHYSQISMIPRWLGGALIGNESNWYWDYQQQTIAAAVRV